MGRVSEHDLQIKIDWINQGLKKGNKIVLGKRYGYKAIDIHRNGGVDTLKTGLSSGEVDLYLDGMYDAIAYLK